MAVKHQTLPGLGTIALYKRRGNRSIRLSVSASGEVRVSLPLWLPYVAAERFVLSKRSWILDRLNGLQQQELKHGQKIGKAHRLVFEPKTSALRVSLRQNEVKISHPIAVSSLDTDVQEAARRGCIRALRHEAEQLLPDRLQSLSVNTGLDYNSVVIKNLKSRWGSCNSSGDIILNLFLMQLPWHLIDYVLIHELTHTKVMRHGPPFWQELLLHSPDARRLRKEIGGHHPGI